MTPKPPTSPHAELASRILARRSLLPFVERINPRYKAGWVHKDICRRLEKFSQDVVDGKSPRLMLLMPPRSGKSELCSRSFPAWHLGKNPDHEIIACSYNVSLAMSFSKKVKEVLEDPLFHPVFEIRLNPNNQSAEEWSLASSKGGYVAAGVGGGITGKGAHLLIIDDPIKNAEEADSPDTREKLWDWYGSTAYTRLAPGGGVLVVQTWWHDDDLAGRLQVAMAQDPDADQFTVVKYPAIAEHDEWLDPTSDLIVDTEPDHPDKILYRRKGEALHPDRYDLPKLEQIKRTISPRFWSALYQQNPVPDDGDYFLKEQFRRAVPPPLNRANVFIAWDFAISEKKLNDYTVGVVLLQDENDTLHVADMVRFKSGDALQIVDAILHLSKKWYTSNQIVGFEDGQIYRAISTLLKKRMHEQRAYFSTQVLKPITDKLARARPLQGRMQQGRVSFDASADWYDACRLEMLRFPAGAHDDQCLIAGTLITMADGTTKPIEAVEVGEYVATPQGPCRVSAASMTNPAAEVTELGLSNGGTLTGTYGHPVWCPVTRMFVPLGGIGLTSKLEYHEIVSIDRGNTSWCGYTQNQSPASAWSSTEKFIAAIRSRLASTCGTISRGLVASTTSPFGSSTTVLCPMGTTSTTRTATRPTMTSPTSNAYLQHTTQLPTQDGAKARSRPSTSSGSARLPKHGTLLQRAWHGTLTMLASLGSTAKNTSSPAATAGRSSHPLSQTRSSAGAHAATSSGCVTTLNITSRKRLGARPVYNLTVDDAHVYYANGVLVHNCDALSWAVQLAIGTQPPRKAKVKPHKSWLDTLNLTGAKGSFMAA